MCTKFLSVLQDADDEVALEAAEFWLSFCESELGMELLIPVLSRLIPVLMKNMVSAEDGVFVRLDTYVLVGFAAAFKQAD
jgi:hypothetical protein